jgi:hypothetical protein
MKITAHACAVGPLAGATQEVELGQLAEGQAAPPGGIAASSGHEMLVALGARPDTHAESTHIGKSRYL